MVQIISAPDVGLVAVHQKGLATTARSFYVAGNIADFYQYAMLNRTSPPDLLICDYLWLDDIHRFTAPRGELAFLRHTPMIVVFDRDRFQDGDGLEQQDVVVRHGSAANIIHCLNFDEQFEPAQFQHLVQAFDHAAAHGAVTFSSFQATFATTEGRRTALDKSGYGRSYSLRELSQ